MAPGSLWAQNELCGSLALRGLRCRPAPASALLQRNLLVYGLGGVVLPFPCIKLIDLALAGMGVS